MSTTLHSFMDIFETTIEDSKTFQKSFLNLLHFPFACQPHEIVDTFFIYRENLFQQHNRWSAESGVFVNKNVRWLIRLFGNT